MQAWQKVWREGIAPLLSEKSLLCLKEALEKDDSRLIQGATTVPPPLACVSDWPVEAACPLGFCGWQGEGKETVGEVEEYFARTCFEVDQKLGEPAACRYFLFAFDETPRSEMFGLLAQEITLELEKRETNGHVQYA